MDLRQLQQDLDHDRVLPLYLLVGDDAFLVGEALSAIRTKVLRDVIVDFNYDQYFLPDTPWQRVLETVEQLPMMSTRRLVITRGVETLKDTDWQEAEALLTQPVDTTVWVLIAAKIDKRKKVFRLPSLNQGMVELARPYERQVPAWLDYMAFNLGLSFKPGAKSLLMQLAGTHLSELNQELRKLKNYLGDRSEIFPDDVLRTVSASRAESIFSLTDAIGRKDPAAALFALAQLLDQGQNEVGVIAMVYRHFRLLTKAKQAVQKGLESQRLAQAIGVAPFFVNQYVQQARQWSNRQLDSAIELLHETDRGLKSSPVSGSIWLENFVLSSCSGHSNSVR